jgi:hypothetical protein
MVAEEARVWRLLVPPGAGDQAVEGVLRVVQRVGVLGIVAYPGPIMYRHNGVHTHCLFFVTISRCDSSSFVRGLGVYYGM